MNTPICDFVRLYAGQHPLRGHMPGHKGVPRLGFEHLDITELDGADSLYCAGGIIAESEKNASSLFEANTFYSTEGSSQCIRAMLYLAKLYAAENGLPTKIAAGRNAHQVFITASALLGLDVGWLCSGCSYLSCPIEPEYLDSYLQQNPAAAVYVTSPDYLGNTLDIAALAEVAHKHHCLLLVDNAHGGYLKFLETSEHPMDLGADICCDSAHKTLSALTGAAYLHISHNAPKELLGWGKQALSLFGSTSPSYLILQSLDYLNLILSGDYREKLQNFEKKVATLKSRLISCGYTLQGNEPLKLTLCTKPYGYTGNDFAQVLKEKNLFSEFHDPDFVVLMLTPDHRDEELQKIEEILTSVPKKPEISQKAPEFFLPQQKLSPTAALYAPGEMVKTEESLGRILAFSGVSCPPAVPIAVSGEIIDENIISALKYYGFDTICVVK